MKKISKKLISRIILMMGGLGLMVFWMKDFSQKEDIYFTESALAFIFFILVIIGGLTVIFKLLDWAFFDG